MKHTLLLTILLFSTLFTFSQYGQLDSTFGSEGMVTKYFGSGFAYSSKVLIQDEEIITIGMATIDGLNKFVLSRYLTSGVIDSTFGVDGTTITQIGSGNTFGIGATFQPDGKIIMVGNVDHANYTSFGVARYLPDGTPDNTFGDGGSTILDLGNSPDQAYAVDLQSDGKILVGGFTGQWGEMDWAIVRFDTDGTLDNSFGENGKVIFDVFGFNDELRDLRVLSDDRFCVTGFAGEDAVNGSATVGQFLADGTPDTSFGTNGFLKIPTEYDYSIAHGMDLTSDEKIVISGNVDIGGSYRFLTSRINSDGTLDESYNSVGFAISDFGDDEGLSAVKVQADGKILAAGQYGVWPDVDFAIVRYNENGTPDNTFGTNGLSFTDFFNNADYGVGIALQNDGKVIVGGSASQDGMYSMALARYSTGITVGIEDVQMKESYFTVYPNPAKSKATLQVYLSSDEDLSVKIFDLSGRLIISVKDNATFQKGIQTIDFSTHELISGIYIIELSSNHFRQSIKLIKQ